MTTQYRCSEISLIEGRLTGTVEARAANAPAPLLEVISRGQSIAMGETAPQPDSSTVSRWSYSIAIPPSVLTDGTQTLLLRELEATETLASLSIMVGEPIDQDVLAELDLLRAELDMLKAAMRRQLGVVRY